MVTAFFCTKVTMLDPIPMKELAKSTKIRTRKDHEDAVREYNELRVNQEKQEAAIVATEKEKEEAERKLAKLQKELDDLTVQHTNTSKLVNEIKKDAVQSTTGGN